MFKLRLIYNKHIFSENQRTQNMKIKSSVNIQKYAKNRVPYCNQCLARKTITTFGNPDLAFNTNIRQ